MKHIPFLPAALLVLASSAPAATLALLHDVDEAKYLEFGETFPAVVQVGGLASGTLVAPDWVLTVAHGPETLQRMRPGKPLKVDVGGRSIEVAKVVVPEQRAADPEWHDIALLRLKESAPEKLAPLPIWHKRVEEGTEFALAGWGILSSGAEGVTPSPQAMASPTRKLRAGWNMIEAYASERRQYFARFDASDLGLALEASPSIGDSGGPALLRVKGKDGSPDTWHILGVIAAIEDVDGDRIIGEYGDEFALTVAADYADWIKATLAE